MHEISQQLTKQTSCCMIETISGIADRLDGAYSLAMMNAKGDMLIARDPLGIKPMCYATDGRLFAAASESVALLNLGFSRDAIKSLEPGHAITIVDGDMQIKPFTENRGRKHCFFEWIYFCLLYTSPSPRDQRGSRMPSSA